MDIITLTCPKCGARLSAASGIDRFICASCGSEHIVRRGGGLAAPVTEPGQAGAASGAGMSAGGTPDEVEFRRLQSEMMDLQTQLDGLAASVARRDYERVARLLTRAGWPTPEPAASRRNRTADPGELTRILLTLDEKQLHTLSANLRSRRLAPQAGLSAVEIGRMCRLRLQLDEHRAEMEALRKQMCSSAA